MPVETPVKVLTPKDKLLEKRRKDAERKASFRKFISKKSRR